LAQSVLELFLLSNENSFTSSGLWITLLVMDDSLLHCVPLKSLFCIGQEWLSIFHDDCW